MWDKWESLFAKNISRFTREELISTAQLNGHSIIVSKRYLYLYEYKLQQNLGKFNPTEIVTLCTQLITLKGVS